MTQSRKGICFYVAVTVTRHLSVSFDLKCLFFLSVAKTQQELNTVNSHEEMGCNNKITTRASYVK